MVAVAARAVRLDDAGLLLAKLVALGLMVLDHADWLLLDGQLGWHDTIGRVVFPLFALVFGYNLARAPLDRLPQIFRRLALFGLLASVVYVPLAGWYPLNVLFTLGAGVLLVSAHARGEHLLAAGLWILAGLLVDYLAFGLLAIVGSWWLFRRGVHPLLVATLAAVAVIPVNLSGWSLLAVPLVAFFAQVQGRAPRLKWLFYGVYPAHLAGLLVIAQF